jgi:hypothetical protein
MHGGLDQLLTLSLMEGTFAVCRLGPEAGLPAWALSSPFRSITRTPDELSIVCRQADVPQATRHEGGWKALKVEGPFDFSAIGVVSSVAAPLAAAGVSIFVMSTFDTDYLLVKGEKLEAAVASLAAAGHAVRRPAGQP